MDRTTSQPLVSMLCLAVWSSWAGCSTGGDAAGSGRTGERGGAQSGDMGTPGSDGATAGQASGQAGAGAADAFSNPTMPAATASSGAGAGAIALGADCAPGHYLGQMGGMYSTAVWGNGTVPIPFGTRDMMDKPGLEFWLTQVDEPCTAEEFCGDFAIEGGKLRGWANPNADPNAQDAGDGFGVRFEMELTGELNCKTGEFRGELTNGCYDILGTLYRIEGTIGASYDKQTDSFVMGEWQLKELPMPGALVAPDPSIGGEGTWDASHADDGSSPIAEGDGLCDKASGFDTQL